MIKILRLIKKIVVKFFMKISSDPHLAQFRINKLVKKKKFLLASCYSEEKAESVKQLVSQAADIPTGNLAECGVYTAGGTIIMAEVLKNKKSDKRIFAFDTFEGMPEPTKFDKMKNGNIHYDKGLLNGTSLGLVKAKARYFKVDKYIAFIKGLFQDTLKKNINEDSKFCLVVIDADQYEGTRFCMEFFYPKLVKGGIIIIDDYLIPDISKLDTPGVKIAVDEFLKDKCETLQHLADSMYYFIKDKKDE